MLQLSRYCGRVTGACTALCTNMRFPLCITSMTWLSSVEAAAPLPSQAKSSQPITSSALHHEAIGKCIRPIWHSLSSTYHGKRHDLTYSSKLWMSGPQLKRQNPHRMSVGSFLLCIQMNVYQLRMLTTYSKMTATGGVILFYRLRVTSSLKSKAVPSQAWSGPEGSRKLRFPDMTMAQDGGKVVSLMHRPPLPPGNIPGTHFC